MTVKTKKATFSLHIDVINGMDAAVSKGQAPSKNTLVERALIKELLELRRQERLALWREGARDPGLLKDLAEVEKAFPYSETDLSERAPE